MKIEREEKKKKGSFFVEEAGKRLARLDYFISAPSQITVYHTEVDPSLRGKGVAQDLVAAVVGYARDKNFKIVPTCPYAKKVIDETAAYRDVLA